MAARVNTKFVIGLSASLIGVCVAAVLLFVFVVQKTPEDHIRDGNAAAAEGDWDKAQSLYGRAVSKDRTNPEYLSVWFDALGKVIPERVQYDNYYQEYRAATEQLARIQRDDLEAQERYLELLYNELRLLYGAPRQLVENLGEVADRRLAFFEASGREGWQRLRRYEGLAIARMLNSGTELSPEDRETAITELRAALEADPTDDAAAIALVQILEDQADRLMVAGDEGAANELRADSDSVLEAVLRANPSSLRARLFEVIIPVARLRVDPEIRSMPGPQAQAELRSRVRPHIERFEALLEEMAEIDRPIPLEVVLRARTMDRGLIPLERQAGSLALVESQLELADDTPGDGLYKAELLRLAGEIHAGRGEYERSIERFDELEALPLMKLSLEGRLRVATQGVAPARTARYAAVWASTAEDEATREKALTIASDARERYRELAGNEAPELRLIDAIVAEVTGDYITALEHYAAYNETTQNRSELALRREAAVAAQLGRFGLARRKFELLLNRNEFDATTLRVLASVERAVGEPSNLRRAAELLTRARSIDPDAERRAETDRQIALIRQRLGEIETDDPVLDAMFRAERIASGEEQGVTDTEEAIRVLRRALDTSNYDPRLVLQLANRLVARGRLDEIKEIIRTAIDRRPDDENLRRLEPVLEAENPADAVLMVLEQADLDPINRELRAYGILAADGRTDEANAKLDELADTYPEDPRVLELTFIRALRNGNREKAERLAQTAAEFDADSVGGLTFEARLASDTGDYERAAELLTDATRPGTVDSGVWRMLALAQQQLGRVDGAIESYQNALSIRENDAGLIFEYVRALAAGNRSQQALAEARRLLDYAESNRRFMELYLNLEAAIGGEGGLQTVIDRRARRFENTPEDTDNAIALAGTYVRAGRLEDAERVLADLREREESLRLVELQASVYAGQSTVETATGPRSGMEMARGVFTDYIIGLTSDREIAEAYLAMARFMFGRGQNETALRAVEQAAAIQDTETREADRLAGDILAALNRHDEAAAAYARVVDNGADTETNTYLIRLVDALNNAREYERALERLEGTGENEAEASVAVLVQRAEALMGLGRRREALRSIDTAIGRAPSNPVTFIRRAQMLLDDPETVREALDDANEAIRIAPDDWRAHRVKATILARMGRTEEAVRTLREVVQLNPSRDEAIITLATMLLDEGRDAEALDAVRSALANRPGAAGLMLSAANVFTQRGYWDRAETMYRMAWDQTGDMGVGLGLIDTLINQTPAQPEAAQGVIDAMNNRGIDTETTPEVLIARAAIERAFNRPNRAEDLLAQAFDELPLNASRINNWSNNVARVFRDDPSGSVEAFLAEQLDRVEDPERRVWLELVLATARLEREQTRAQGLSTIRSLAEQTDSAAVAQLAMRTLALRRYNAGDVEAATDLWRTMLERFGEDWRILNNLGYAVAIDLGRPEEGLPFARRALELNSSQATIANTVARIQIELGRLDEAQAMLDRSEAMSGGVDVQITRLLHTVRLRLAQGRESDAGRILENTATTLEQLPGSAARFEPEIDALRARIEGEAAQNPGSGANSD